MEFVAITWCVPYYHATSPIITPAIEGSLITDEYLKLYDSDEEIVEEIIAISTADLAVLRELYQTAIGEK